MGTKKYNWIVVKTVGNIVAILYGSSLMRIWFEQTMALSPVAQFNQLSNPAYLHNRQMLIIGTLISLGILLFLLIVSVFKPWGKHSMLRMRG